MSNSAALLGLSKRLNRKPRISILAGAGVSAGSRIQTFRGADGLWNGNRAETIATSEAFAKD